MIARGLLSSNLLLARLPRATPYMHHVAHVRSFTSQVKKDRVSHHRRKEISLGVGFQLDQLSRCPQDFFKQLISTAQGRSTEVRQYLKHFSKIDSQKFAVLLIEETLDNHDLGCLASSLTFVHK